VEEQACSCRYTPLKLKDNDFEVRKQQDINQQNLNYLTRGDNIMEVALHMSPEAGVTSTLMKSAVSNTPYPVSVYSLYQALARKSNRGAIYP